MNATTIMLYTGSSFSPNSTTLPTTPLNDWLIWHEVGHNAAETPLTVPGATEVANNVLALYMQDRYLGKAISPLR